MRKSSADRGTTGLALGLALAAVMAAQGEDLVSKFYGKMRETTPSMLEAPSGAITAIGIQRAGSGPKYMAVFKADGSVQCSGLAEDGKNAGALDPAVFQQLSDFARTIGFFDLKNRYKSSRADAAAVYTSVTAGGREKVILDYDGQGPSGLRLFEREIDQALQKVRWTQE